MSTLKFKKVSVGMQKDNRYFNTPAIILELTGCNMRCIVSDELCKNAFHAASDNISIEQAIKFVKSHSNINHILIKGGEPLLYKKELENFLDEIWKDNMIITIHTNGTMPILNPLGNKYKVSLYVVKLLDYPIPTVGTSVEVNGEKITLGTSDIQQVEQYIENRTKSLQDLCTYSIDYLLCIKPQENLTKQISELCEGIKKSDYDFIQNYFNVHPIHSHIVLISDTKENTETIVKTCKKTGYMFNTLTNL